MADTRRGQIFALFIGIFAIGVGGSVAVLGQPIVGGVLGAGGLIGLVKAFIDGRKNDNTTTSDKPKQIASTTDDEDE